MSQSLKSYMILFESQQLVMDVMFLEFNHDVSQLGCAILLRVMEHMEVNF